MKPRTKLEKEVAKLNATLSQSISVCDANWVKRSVRDVWGVQGNSAYFSLYTNIKDWELNRLYRVYLFDDKSTTHYFFVEIMREFKRDGNRLYFGKQRAMGCYYDVFNYGSNMELRDNHANYAGHRISDLFDGFAWGIRAQHGGKKIACDTTNPNELAKVICNNPVAENMYKQNDPLFHHILYSSNSKKICRAITLAKRHGFVFTNENTSLWFDMVKAIIYCKYDWHNPVFIAPKDLQTTHDRFIKMRERKRDKERRMAAIELKMSETDRKLMKEKRTNDAYIKRRKRFYDMVLTDGVIYIKVLPDVPAFREEASFMEHCVYTNEYYKKPYSLIMSATIGSVKQETIEVNLANYTINQCFGKRNQLTMYHKRIVDLVNSNMETIKYYNTTRKRSTKQMKNAV